MTNNAAKNNIVSQTRFSINQKINYEKAAQSCADLARKKFEDELRIGHKYNNKMLDEHKARIAQDEC